MWRPERETEAEEPYGKDTKYRQQLPPCKWSRLSKEGTEEKRTPTLKSTMKNSQLEKELEKESTGQGETQAPVWSKRSKEECQDKQTD